MYVNKIDELINKIINDFFTYITKHKKSKSILEEINFVKYQQEINDLMIEFMDNIDSKLIDEIVENNESKTKLKDIISRYVTMYLFMFVSASYNGKKENYINNMVEFTRNQSIFKFKVKNFFNGENNSLLFKYYSLIKNIIHLLSLDKTRYSKDSIKPEFREAVSFLDGLGKEIVDKMFRIESLKGNKHVQYHNIIKTIIINDIYLAYEKKDLHSIIESLESNTAVHAFIDIVVPRYQIIDFNMIESILNEKEIMRGMVYELHDIITEKEERELLDHEEKINRLINYKVLTPITEDFLRYHKDNEKYEKPGAILDQSKKKKEDTKIRFIVSKIDSVAEYYSQKDNNEAQKNIEKNFNAGMHDRRIVTINQYEEVKILNKMENQTSKTVENLEYLNDLLNIRSYPYVNFKDFSKYGFKHKLNKTVEIMRSVSLETSGLFKQNPRSIVQVRTGSNNMTVNIVGFVFPSRVNPLPCLKVNQLIDIRKINEGTNGYNLMLGYLSKTKLINKKNKSSVYWLFDLEKDNIIRETYDKISGVNADQEYIKLMMSKFYDDFSQIVFEYVVNYVKEMKLTYEEGLNFSKRIQRDVLLLNNNMNELLRKEILINSKKSTIKEDEHENIMSGLFGDIVKLVENKNNKKNNNYDVLIKQDFIENNRKEELSEAVKLNAICQHFVDWDELNNLKKSNPQKFTQDMYNFIAKYVIETEAHGFICKSCGTQIDLRKYVADGVYDNDSNKYITFTAPMDVNLEEMREYQKYKISIRSIDKLIERIASIANIPALEGNQVNTRIRRKKMVRNVIDLLLLHNQKIKDTYNSRKKDLEQKYGINSELSRLFRFELENSIFIYSSKDTDKYKQIKYNNVITYILILIILDLNQSQIVYLANDKVCNYENFEKAGHLLLEGLKIVKNKSQETLSVRSLRVLSYLIYYFSCISTKFKIWNYDVAENLQERKKQVITIQKTITHTIVDVLNSFLEMANQVKSENGYIYEIITTKFFISIDGIFKNKELSTRLHSELNKKSSNLGVDKKYIVAHIKPIKLTGEYQKYDYCYFNPIRTTINKRFVIPNIEKKRLDYFTINNITNREDGTFRKWIMKKGVNGLVDEKTDELFNIKYNEGKTTETLNNHRYIVLEKLAEEYFKRGELKKIMNDSNDIDPSKFDRKKYDLFESNLRKIRMKKDLNDIKEEKYIINRNESRKLHHELISSLKNDYGKTKDFEKDYFGYINDFIDKLVLLVGSDKTNLKYNLYIIDHNHEGLKLKEPIQITDANERIKYKNNHPFFKKNVLYYTNETSGKIDVFYDATNYVLIGYKESHKDYVENQNKNTRLYIKYSTLNRLKQFGYEYNTYNIQSQIEKLKNVYKENSNDDFILNNIFESINRDRMDKLKIIMRDVVQIINQIKNKFNRHTYTGEEIYNDETNVKDEQQPKDPLDYFMKKLTKFETRDKNGKNRIFKHWNDLTNSLYYKENHETINFNINDFYITNYELAKYDYHGNLLLYYIINELNKLLDYNENKFIKNDIALLIVKMIDDSFMKYDNGEKLQNKDIRRFKYILESKIYVDDIQEQGAQLQNELEEGSYEDDEKRQEELLDAQEENDALDIDIDAETDLSDMYQVDYTFSPE
jgi:hypothetical protein